MCLLKCTIWQTLVALIETGAHVTIICGTSLNLSKVLSVFIGAVTRYKNLTLII